MTNQLPPEFDHLRDDSVAQDLPFTEASSQPRESLLGESRLGRSSTPLIAAALAVMACVVVAVLFLLPSKMSSSKLSPKDAVAKIEMTPAPKEIIEPQLAMAEADQKTASGPWPDQAAKDVLAQINQRLGAVERTVENLVVSNSTHLQTLESLRAEQAQLLLKVHDNENSLTGIKSRVDLLQTKFATPKKPLTVSDNGNPKAPKSATTTSVLASPKASIASPTSLAPVKPKATLPANIRLVSLKNMNGKNIAVIRIGGDFSPMLFEGQRWNGIQLLSASVHERSAQIGFQGDEFGLVL